MEDEKFTFDMRFGGSDVPRLLKILMIVFCIFFAPLLSLVKAVEEAERNE